MNGSVKIGREFFGKIKLDYADWRYALIREFLQNSFDAPGCSEVRVTVHRDGPNTVLVVANNGAPMTKEILLDKLLTLGGSGKNFEGENTGGFGVAKSLLYYCHEGYTITTGEHFVCGEGASYTLELADPPVRGTSSMIVVKGDEVSRLSECCKRFASMAQWKGRLFLNDTELPCDLHKGSRRRDMGWGVVYTNKSFENLCIVRLNGQPMFTRFTRFKGCVLIELTGKACETLTSNRDALKWKLDSELTDLLTALSVDKKTALREQKAEYKRYRGELQKNEARKPKAADEGLAALIIPTELASVLGTTGSGKPAKDAPRIEPVPETAKEGGGGIKVVVESKEDEPDTSISVGPEFILKNTTGLKTPVWYVPGEKFSNTSKELVLAWTATLLKLYQLTNLSGEFSVGFVFDEESVAEHETGVYGRVYYINPAKIVEETGKRRMEARFDSVWAARHEIISSAAHEFVHGAYDCKEHDEEYSSRLTSLMGLVLKHLDELTPFYRGIKPEPGTETKRTEHEELYGHSVSAVVRWMGANGWKFSHARSALDALGYKHVADGTVRTYLQAGKAGLRGAPADLTEEARRELEEKKYESDY